MNSQNQTVVRYKLPIKIEKPLECSRRLLAALVKEMMAPFSCPTHAQLVKEEDLQKLEADSVPVNTKKPRVIALLRALFSKKAATYEQLLKWVKLLSLENRRLQDILILMYKVKHNLVPKTIIDIFPISNSKFNLHNKNFSIPRVNTTKYSKHSIRYLGPYLWSKININLRQKTSHLACKDAIRGMDIKGLLHGSCNCQVCQY